MKNIRMFLSENFQLLEVKFSIYLNGRVFIMILAFPGFGISWVSSIFNYTFMRKCAIMQLHCRAEGDLLYDVAIIQWVTLCHDTTLHNLGYMY